jgi:hypothetical protein
MNEQGGKTNRISLQCLALIEDGKDALGSKVCGKQFIIEAAL